MRQILLLKDAAGLGDILEAELMSAFEVTTSGNEQNARAQLPGDFDLVITPLNIRPTPVETVKEDAERGLELLRWMDKMKMNKPSILIATEPNDRLRAAQSELKNCFLATTGGNMVQEIVQHAEELVTTAPQKCLHIEIQLQSERLWKYKVTGRGFPYAPPEEEIEIDKETLEDLKQNSLDIAALADRNGMLLSIGRKLIRALLKEPKFSWAVSQGLEKVGDETNTRVLFVVRPDMHGIAFEAVLCPLSDDRHWALYAPVYRRLLSDSVGELSYLFQGGGRIDCLIVDAPTSGLMADVDKRLRKLTKTTEECDWLENFLKQQKAAGDRVNLGVIKRLPDPASPKPLSEQLKEALNNRWGIFHFAGHSYYNDALSKGYVFLPGESGSIPWDRFSDLLRTVTFTYLSSCESGAGPFVFALANRRVPNILGFRWPISDDWAYRHAQSFYTHLFNERSLEKAYFKARQDSGTDNGSSWAASILIKQLEEI